MTDTAIDLPHLLTDAPASTDLLGFKPHAERLAALIQKQIPDKASFVIGIEGEWGEGKSSFIKLLQDALRSEKDEAKRPTIVDFNPWWFEGSDQLLRHFFDELLGQIDRSGRWTAPARKFMRGLAGLLDGGGKAAQLIPDPSVMAAGKAAETASGLLHKLGVEKTRSAQVLKASSKHVLEAQQFKTIVFIDDLDRLPAREIVELFRVIKAVADLPNIVYVIAYDRAIVASALDDVHKARGEAYLEKIVQLPYRLPKPTQAQFFAYNAALLAGYVGTDTAASTDKNKEQETLAMVVNALLPLPRDVKRLLTILEIHRGVPDEIRMDNLDFMFLEAMRLKNQPLWCAMINAWLDCEHYARMETLLADQISRQLGKKESAPDRQQWVDSHFKALNVQEPALLAAVAHFTGWSISPSQKIASVRRQSGRGLSQLGLEERTEDLKELVAAYLQRVLPETALTQQQIREFVLTETAEQIADAIKSCVFPLRLLQAASDFIRQSQDLTTLSNTQLESHLLAIAKYMNTNVDFSLLDEKGHSMRASWVFSGWFSAIEQYIRDGLLMTVPDVGISPRGESVIKDLLRSWLSENGAPRTIAELVFSSSDAHYHDMKSSVIAYFTALPLEGFLSVGVAGEMLKCMSRADSEMQVYRQRWLEMLSTLTAATDNEKELLGRQICLSGQGILQSWLIEAKPFMRLVEEARDFSSDERIRDGCMQFLAQAEEMLAARRT